MTVAVPDRRKSWPPKQQRLRTAARLTIGIEGRLPLKRKGPLDPEIERAAQSFQYIREMTKAAYARERFSALDLPCFGSVLRSKFTR